MSEEDTKYIKEMVNIVLDSPDIPYSIFPNNLYFPSYGLRLYDLLADTEVNHGWMSGYFGVCVNNVFCTIQDEKILDKLYHFRKHSPIDQTTALAEQLKRTMTMMKRPFSIVGDSMPTNAPEKEEQKEAPKPAEKEQDTHEGRDRG